MGYIGNSPTQAGQFRLLEDLNGLGYNSGAYNGSFDGSETTFRLSVSGAVVTPSIASVIIVLDGVIQEHTASYSVSGSDIIFTEAPPSGVDFFGYLMGVSSFVDSNSIGAAELNVSGNGSQGQSLISDGDGTFTWSSVVEGTISDGDNDTKIQTEESADEDVIRFDIGGSEKMVLNGSGLTITGNLDVTGVTTETSLTASDSMVINNAGSDVGLKVNSTSTGHIMQLQDNATDVFVVQDGGGVNIAGTFKIGDVAVTSTAAELNILDGVTSTAAEINLLDGVSGLVQADFTKLAAVDSTAAELNIVDGGTSATSTTLADADRLVVNDNGTMVQVALTDFETYFESALDTLNSVTSASSLATVGTIGTGTWEGTTIAVDQGGTGQTTLAAYRTSLFGASDLPVTHGGTGASSAGSARTNLGVDAAGTDNSTDVTLAGTPDYITISGQVITRGTIDIGDDTNLVAGTGITLTDDTLSIDAAQTQITSLGTITTFRSTGIDDNADQLVLTLGSDESATFAGTIKSQTDTYPQLTLDGTDNSGNIGFSFYGAADRGGMRWNSSNNDVEILKEGGSVEISLLDGGGTTFAGDLTVSGGDITLVDGGTVGIGGAKWTFDDSNDDISTTGKVGIGTAAPGSELHVKGSALGVQILLESTGTNSYPNIALKNDAISWGTYADGDDKYKIYSDVGSPIARFTIDTAGKVGITTTAPDYKFETEVDSTATHLASIGMTTQGSYGSNLVFKADNVGETVELRASTASGGGQLDIFTKTTGGTATQRLRIDNAGKVTIAGDLEVQGTTTTVDTATLTVEDPIFQLASGQTSPSADAGFIIKRYSSPSGSNYNVGLIWDEGSDTFEFANTFEAAADTDITIQNHTIVKTGNLLPGADATYDLGSSSLQWNNVYMADLNLNNETHGGNEVDGTTGQWTIQEGQEDLFLINRRSGKKYKFNLTEVI